MNKSIEKRLLYSFTAIASLVLIVVSLGLSYIIHDFFWDSRKRELIANGRRLAMAVGELGGGDQRRVAEYLRSVDNFLQARIWLVDSEKRILASSIPMPGIDRERAGMHKRHGEEGRFDDKNALPPRIYTIRNPNMQEMVDEVMKGEIRTIRVFHPYFEDNVMAVGLPVMDKGRKVTGVLLLNASVANAEEFLQTIYFYIAGVGLVAMLLSWCLTKLLTRRIVMPLISMRESAAAMAQGDYDCQVLIRGEDEVADLGRSLNLLARDLANFVDKTKRMEQLRRDFVANVSHELRTPITVIRGYNEAMLDGTITDADKTKRYQSLIRDETIRLEGLIRELLDISRLQARVEQIGERVPLDVIAAECAEKLMVKAKERGVAVTVDTDSELYVKGIGNRLVQLIMILLDNAIKYSHNGGRVKLAVKSLEEGEVLLAVHDNGIGVAAEEQERIWERFYKVDKSPAKAAGGPGLGLAIAREIIDIHKAKVALESNLGEGTKIQVIFAAAN
ncbi:MAG: HAMP domain-containing histidine kinase [Acidaminococcales bacterium]|jgi:signal transduction histidine kinase|nr:HAMP domain-containing histidine kinase [Acidaminococcales bacterium]